jgi:hypothetical protein
MHCFTAQSRIADDGLLTKTSALRNVHDRIYTVTEGEGVGSPKSSDGRRLTAGDAALYSQQIR